MEEFHKTIAARPAIRPGQVAATAALLAAGANVPFVARYREDCAFTERFSRQMTETRMILDRSVPFSAIDVK
jgi:transcriptional accessory protein Tex/SPT6